MPTTWYATEGAVACMYVSTSSSEEHPKNAVLAPAVVCCGWSEMTSPDATNYGRTAALPATICGARKAFSATNLQAAASGRASLSL